MASKRLDPRVLAHLAREAHLARALLAQAESAFLEETPNADDAVERIGRAAHDARAAGRTLERLAGLMAELSDGGDGWEESDG